jgi:hypothetical protein
MEGGRGGFPSPPQKPYYFNNRALQKMNNRGITLQDISEAFANPSGVSIGESGNVQWSGNNGVTVIFQPEDEMVVSVFRLGAQL